MPPPYPPGTNSLPPGGTLIINQTPIIGGTDTYILYDNNGVVGVEPASSLGLTVGVTPISGGTAGYVLSDNGGTLEEVPASSLSFAFYVNGSTGSDSNTGLSPGSAWKTISKVNASTFSPGAGVLFAGGQTFSGAIVSPNAGTAAQPITFGSYGGGQATISSGTSNGFTSTNQAGIIVRDLTFTGSSSTNSGILFVNSSSVQLQNIRAINCNISGYGQQGIGVSGITHGFGYDDIFFQGCNVSACCGVANGGLGTAGIYVRSFTGNSPVSFTNLIIDNCVVSGCTGTSDTNWTASGIIISDTNFGIVRGSVATGNGASSVSSGGGGPFGIWCISASNILFHGCRSTFNSTGNNEDGGGFDFDANCQNCRMVDCYSEGNTSCGFMILSYNNGFGANDRSVLINCVSVNDGVTGNNTPCGIRIANNFALTNIRVVGCQVYTTDAASNPLRFDGTNTASTTGDIINCGLNVSGTSAAINGSVPAGVILTAVLEGVGGSNTYKIYNSDSTEILSAYFSAFSTTGVEPGLYVGLNSDTHSRVTTALSGADAPVMLFGPGNTAQDTGISRPAVATLAFGNGTVGDSTAVIESGNHFIGSHSSVSTATPQFLDLGGTFSNTAGQHPKLYLYNDTTFTYGLGVSGGQLDLMSGNSFAFYNAGSLTAMINGSGQINAVGGFAAGGTAGISATITTAKLTPATGANGSMTFVNGILTAQTQAT